MQQTDMGGSGPLPTITPTTYEAVRKMMAEEGIQPRDNEAVSEYVQKLVARESLFRVVDRIQQRNKDVDPKTVQQEVDLAVKEVKAERRKQNPGADRS
ncbi:MAG: hypothetical protein MI725_09795 [Pirellulales bacterium]|nr:hypothetical protein [Pirellulales bacterium]